MSLVSTPGCTGLINLPDISLGLGCNDKRLFLAHSPCPYCGSNVALPHLASNSSPRLTEQPLSWTLGGVVAEEKEMWKIILNDTPHLLHIALASHMGTVEISWGDAKLKSSKKDYFRNGQSIWWMQCMTK